MTFRTLINAIVAATVLFFSMETAMAFGKTITFFSETTGQLVDASGAPQPDVRVTRSYKLKADDPLTVEEAVTDASGRFHFEAATDRSFLASFLPGTPAIKQEIAAQTADGPLTLWKAVKTSFDANSELEGRPLTLVCRIDQEPNAEGPAWGTCKEADAPRS